MTLHIRIEQSDLLKTLGHMRSVVSRRSPVPMLNNTLLSAKEHLVLVATDLEMVIHETATAEVLSPGDTTVPALILYDIVTKCPAGSKIELIERDNGTLLLKAERAEFTLQTLSASDFPDSSSDEELDGNFSLKIKDLRQMIQSVGFCMAQDEARQYLNGAYLHTVEGEKRQLRLIATDGHRLAQFELPLEDELSASIPNIEGMIIPRKMVDELRRLIEEGADPEATVRLSYSERKLHVHGEGWRLICRLLSGSYPNYQAVIPQEHKHSFSSSRKALLESVDRLLTVADQTNSIKFDVKEQMMTLRAWMVDGPQGKDEIPVDFSDNYSTGFNGRFVRDICGQIQEDEINFYIQETPDPVVIRGKDNQTTLYVLMPLRI